MPRTKKSEDQFGALRKIGFELRAPVDEYSEQPGSGGTMGGRRGTQEYGIEGGVAQEDGHDRDRASNVDINSSDIEPEGARIPQDLMDRSYPGVSQYTSEHMVGAEQSEPGLLPSQESIPNVLAEEEGETIGRADLETLLRQRLMNHPELKNESIQISIDEERRAFLRGRVHSDAARMHVQEIAEAVLGSNDIANLLEVEAARP